MNSRFDDAPPALRSVLESAEETVRRWYERGGQPVAGTPSEVLTEVWSVIQSQLLLDKWETAGLQVRIDVLEREVAALRAAVHGPA